MIDGIIILVSVVGYFCGTSLSEMMNAPEKTLLLCDNLVCRHNMIHPCYDLVVVGVVF